MDDTKLGVVPLSMSDLIGRIKPVFISEEKWTMLTKFTSINVKNPESTKYMGEELAFFKDRFSINQLPFFTDNKVKALLSAMNYHARDPSPVSWRGVKEELAKRPSTVFSGLDGINEETKRLTEALSMKVPVGIFYENVEEIEFRNSSEKDIFILALKPAKPSQFFRCEYDFGISISGLNAVKKLIDETPLAKKLKISIE
jgi:hypothetical protein